VVSVAGPKQYLAVDAGRKGLDRIGEDMQLYQLIRFEAQRLHYQSLTVTGKQYDAFDIEYRSDGSKFVTLRQPSDATETRCSNPNPPRPTRCWEGTELVR
jgi:hypothetical protein